MKKKIIVSLGILPAFLFASSAFALETNVNVTGSAEADSSFLKAQTNTSAQVKSGTNAEANSKGDSSSTMEVKVMPVNASVNVNLEHPIVVNRAGLKLGSTSVQTISASSVSISSEADMQALVEAMLAADANIKLIKIENDSTEVDYEYNGKFLGIFPVKPTLKAKIDSEGKVKVKFPWYEAFVRRTTAITEANVSADVDAGASLRANQSALTSKARALVSLSSSLKAHRESK